MSTKAKVTLIRMASLQVEGLLRGQQGTGSRTLHLPSERGWRANISMSRKLIRDHPLILSVYFPSDKLSISATCAHFLEPGGQGDEKDAKNPVMKYRPVYA